MKKNGKNEELQSRREFFKRAAKGALPILAGAALLSSPILSETANAMSCAGCNNRCMNSCFNTLKSYIYNSVAELRISRKKENSLPYFKSNSLRSLADNFPASPRFSTCHKPVSPAGAMKRSILSSFVRRSAS